jgi:hypothetical protein
MAPPNAMPISDADKAGAKEGKLNPQSSATVGAMTAIAVVSKPSTIATNVQSNIRIK